METIYFLQKFIAVLCNLMTYAVIGRVIVSWFQMGMNTRPYGGVSGFLYDVTDPIIRLSKKLPHTIGFIDLSPLIALLGIDLFRIGMIYILNYLATLI